MANGKSIARSGLALCVVFGLLCGAAYSQVPPGYYDEVNGKTGQALRDALHEIIDDHQVIPYSSSSFDTHDAMCNLDEDPLNPLNVILVYSGYSVAKSTWPDWNREHLWPASYGVDLGPAKSDLFSLNPCDMNVNSSRGNKYFDEGGTSFHPEAPECRYDFDSWEPRDIEKGDLARAMFYMDVRYSGDQSDELDLELTDDVNLIQSGSRYMGRLSTLLAWHEADPVDDRERARCEGIYALYQGNRNPFVDHPSWVYAIWGGKLSTDTYSFDEGTGGSADFVLNAGPAQGNRNYLLFAGFTGMSPGLPLPGGQAVLPLNWDLLTGLAIGLANTPMFQDFMGNLDGAGEGSATLNLPPLPGAAGLTLGFAYALNNPWDFVSNPVEIRIVP